MSKKNSKSAKNLADPLSPDYGKKMRNKANEKTPYESPEPSKHTANK